MIKTFFKHIVVFIITLEARVVLYKYKHEIVAVTGRVGKTSTKDVTAAVLSHSFSVRSAKKSFNSEIGVPLTILGCENAWNNIWRWFAIFIRGLELIFLKNHYPNILVLEVGTDRPGDIKKIASWLHPDIVVFTAFPEVPVHVEFFTSRAELIEEKKYVAHALKKNGVLILNADDRDVASLRERFPHTVITYGMAGDADISLKDSSIEYNMIGAPVGMRGAVCHKGQTFPLHIKGVLGKHLFYSVLAAFAVGIAKGLSITAGIQALQDFSFPAGRGVILEGVSGSVIVDDSYNASPVAVVSGLRTLQEVKTHGRKIAVLGDMLELGKFSAEEHRKIGIQAKEVVEILVTVGIRSLFIEDAAAGVGMNKGHLYHFENSIDAGKFLKGFVSEGDVVLVKGSQSVRMEKAVEQILKEPERKKEFLVRQEDAWQKR